MAAEVRRPLHRARRSAHRRTAGLGRRQAGEGQRVPSAPRLRPHRGGPVERPPIGGFVLQMTVDEFHRSSAVHGHRVVQWRVTRRRRTDLRDWCCRTRVIATRRRSWRCDPAPCRRRGRTCSRLPAAAACRRLTSPPRWPRRFVATAWSCLTDAETRALSRRRYSGRRTSPAFVRPAASRATCTTCRATCSIVSPRSRRVTTSPIATRSPCSSTDAW